MTPPRPRRRAVARAAGGAWRAWGAWGAWVAALAAATLALVPGTAWAQTATRLLLERRDAAIEIVNEGRADEGARSILDLAGCVPGEDLRSNLFYAPTGGVTARIDNQDGEPTVVEAPLVIVLRPEADEGAAVDGADGPAEADDAGAVAADDAAGDDAAGDDAPRDDETLEALDATATFGRPPCLEEVTPAEEPRVELRQGRSTATGTRFFLDRGADVADLDGPVTLVRTPEGDGPTVEATAEALRFDLDAGRSTLTGTVRVTAGERTSEADALELDEEAGVAILTGEPAVSRSGEDEVSGSRLLYDLETNDVVVEGAVSARFEIEGEAPEVPSLGGGEDDGGDAAR